MIIGTIFIGIGLTFLNVLLPSLVAEYYPNKTSLLTSIYTLIMTLCSAISAGISVPLTNILSWQKTILIFSIPIIINIGSLGHQSLKKILSLKKKFNKNKMK